MTGYAQPDNGVLIFPLAPHGGIAGNQQTLAEIIEARGYQATAASTIAEAYELAPRFRQVITPLVKEQLFERAKDLELIQLPSAGYDHVNLDLVRSQEVKLVNGSGIHAIPIAEQVLAYILAFERNLVAASRRFAGHEWRKFPAGELHGKRALVVGLGAIGSKIAEYLSVLGVEVQGTKRDPSSYQGAAEAHPADQLEELLPAADYVILACPLTSETHHLLSTPQFVIMKNTAVVVNIARGGVIDTRALISALQREWIGGAALDVIEDEPVGPDHPIWSLSNVIFTPHMAGCTPAYLERVADIYEHNLAAAASERDWLNRIV